jgi:hypothetical protein
VSRPWSPAEAEQALAEVVEQLAEAVVNLRGVTMTAAKADHAFKLAEAREYTTLRAMGVPVGEANKTVMNNSEVASAHLHHVMAEAVAKAAYKHIDVLKARADGLRSLLVSARGVSS